MSASRTACPLCAARFADVKKHIAKKHGSVVIYVSKAAGDITVSVRLRDTYNRMPAGEVYSNSDADTHLFTYPDDVKQYMLSDGVAITIDASGMMSSAAYFNFQDSHDFDTTGEIPAMNVTTCYYDDTMPMVPNSTAGTTWTPPPWPHGTD